MTSVGKEAADDLIHTYQYPKDKIKVIKRGVEFQSFDRDAVRQEIFSSFGFGKESLIILHVGHFSAEKNHRFLLACFEKIVTALPAARLVCIGDGPMRKPLMDNVQQYSWGSSVAMPGHRHDVQRFCGAADVMLMVSTVEGVPGVVLEAALHAVPSVGVNVGGVKEVIIDGQTGVLINGHNTNSVSEAVVYLLTHDKERRTMGAAAKQYVLSNYDMEHTLDAYEHLFHTLMSFEN